MDEIRIIPDRANTTDEQSRSTNGRPTEPVGIHAPQKRSGSKRTVLVIDVSSGKFRYVYAARHKRKLKIIDFGEISGEELGVDPPDSFDLYRAGVAWIGGNADFNLQDILVVSSRLDFFIRRIELPLGRKREAERASKWEIEKQIPIKSSESYLKLRWDDMRKDSCRVTVGAAPKNEINGWQFLGKKLIGVVPTAVALTAAGPKAISKDIAYCYVYREDSTLCIGFYNSDGLQYSHPIITGPTESGYDLLNPSIDSTRIVDEFSSSMEVFYSRFPGMRVSGIILFVPPEEISQIAPVMEENIVLDVIPIDFPENVDMDDCPGGKKLDIKYFPLVGAARLKSDDFLFLPKSLQDNIKTRIARKILAYGFTAGLALLMLLSAYWIADGEIMSSQLKGLIAQKENITNSPAYRKSREYMTRIGMLRSLKDRFTKADHIFSQTHIALGNLAPEHIYINSLILNHAKEPRQVEISGYFDGDLSRADVAILNFMDNLKMYGLETLKLKRLGSKLSGPQKFESFTITGELARHE